MEKRVCLGKIVAAHGIRGEVKVRSYTQNASDIDRYGELENRDGTRRFKIKSVGMAKENVRVKIDGVCDRNAAEALIGTELYVGREVLPELPEEEFYKTDLIGLKVCLRTPENEIGTVEGFCNFGAGDILEIRITGQKETEMLPFTAQYVPTVNLNDGYIIVSSATMIFAPETDDGSEC